MRHFFFAFTLILFASVSCKKKDNKDATPFEGNIAVDAPAPGDTINGGNFFMITGTIYGNMEMHGYHVIIYNQNDQSVVYETVSAEHSTSYALSLTVSHTLAASTPLRLDIEAAVDHDGTTLTKEILFNYEP